MDKEGINTKKLKLGIFSKSLIVAYIFFYLVSFANKNFTFVYAQIPLFTIQWLELYRLFTGIFISFNIFDLILNLSVILIVINTYENKEGTIKTLIKFFISAILIQLFVISLYYSIYILSPLILSYAIKPTLAIGIAFITKHILLTDFKHFVFYTNCVGNNRWLAVIYLVMGILFNYGEFKFELLFALYYGFLTCKIPKYFDYSPSEESILHFEKNENYKFFFNMDSWILIEECFFKGVCYSSDQIENGRQISQVEHLDVSEGEHLDFTENSEFKLIERNIDVNSEKENDIQLISKI
jgi:membrane associated rhomboid family serine protease